MTTTIKRTRRKRKNPAESWPPEGMELPDLQVLERLSRPDTEGATAAPIQMEMFDYEPEYT